MRASTEALGILTLLKDFGCPEMRASVGMDASAAIGIVQRQGISKLRHVEVDVLWIQKQQARRFLPLRKVPGPRKPSDMGTKNVPVALLDQYLGQLNLEVVGSRVAIAQQLHTSEEKTRPRAEATNAHTVSSKPSPAHRGMDSWTSKGGEWDVVASAPDATTSSFHAL